MRIFSGPLPRPITDYYFSAFLTQACNLNCPYCRQKFNLTSPEEPIHERRDIPMFPMRSGQEWVGAINEIEDAIPSLHIQGGEPSLHPDFFSILNGIKFRLTMDTNLTFDAERFVKEVKRPISIYCTFHPTQGDPELFAKNYHVLRDGGFKVYPNIVPDPYHKELVQESLEILRGKGVPMSISGYIGWVNGKLSPPYREEPYRNTEKKNILCLCREILFAPDGSVYNCPAKLDRKSRDTYGNIFRGDVSVPVDYILCTEFGFCNPCSEFYTDYKESENSRVSVTFITRNRPGFAFLCLSSLLGQTFKNWDLIVIDDSEPPLSEYVEFRFLFQLMEHYGHKVKIVANKNLGITQAWQRGLELSECEFGQRLEDDVWLEPTYLENLFRVISQRDNVAAVAGSNPNPFKPQEIRKVVSEPFPNFLIQQGDIYVPIDGQATLDDTRKIYKVCHLHGLFMYRKSAVDKVGGFSTWMTRVGHRDETDLSLRLYFAGYDLLVYPKARLWHAEALYGGARDGLTPEERAELQRQDEAIFQKRVKEWIANNPDKWREEKIQDPWRLIRGV